MKLIAIAASALLFAGCTTIKVPYFDEMTPEEVCGGASKYCQPTSSEHWAKVKPGKDYNNKVGNVLGRKFENVFATYPCVTTKPTIENVNITGKATIEGTITSETKNELKAKIDADIVKLIEENTGQTLKDLNINLASEVSSTTQNMLTQNIALTYERIDLNQDFMDAYLEQCISTLTDEQNVITGISVITVQGEWSKKTLNDILAKIEATASYQSLSAEAKNKYTLDKKRILDGKFEPITYYFAVAYRP